MADIEIEIDGKVLKAAPNQTIIQVADAAGIYIPRFCYHPHLTIPANCRMCLVEVEKMPKVAPACATPVMAGMKVFTKSQKTLLAQRAVMEFLLINHPLDCPICDQGGECELQDLSMGYGSPWSKYRENKRAVPDQNLGSLIATEMTRCIHCTRCVRFGDEIAGIRELGLIGRGEFTEISTYVQHAMQSEISGNIIDLCPVGALTSKPFRFTARAWELEQYPSISPHDCLGTNINIHVRGGKVMRVVPRENKDINQTWISDRDRFSYTGLYHPERLLEPMIKVAGQWQSVGWEQALEFAAKGLQATIAEFGSDKVAGLATASATVEEFYLLQKIMRGLGSPHIDYRLREVDTSDEVHFPTYPGLATSLAELAQSDAIIIIGSHLATEQPLINVRIRQAALRGAQVIVINPIDYHFNFAIAHKAIVAPHLLLAYLQNLLTDTSVVHALLAKKSQVHILLGALAMHHHQAASIRALSQQLADKYHGHLSLLTEGANAAGAWLAGAIPHRAPAGLDINRIGLSAHALLEKPRHAYLLVNVEPELDCANAAAAVRALEQANFNIALSIYQNAVLDVHADVILPMTPFTETSGTYVNLQGDWQHFAGVAKPLGQARPAWKILRALGNFLHLEHFAYEDSQSIAQEVQALVAHMPKHKTTFPHPVSTDEKHLDDHMLQRIGEIPIYAVDSIVRRAHPLQVAQLQQYGDATYARIHPQTASAMNIKDAALITLQQDNLHMKVVIKYDAAIAQDAIYLAGGIKETAGLGALFGMVKVC